MRCSACRQQGARGAVGQLMLWPPFSPSEPVQHNSPCSRCHPACLPYATGCLRTLQATLPTHCTATAESRTVWWTLPPSSSAPASPPVSPHACLVEGRERAGPPGAAKSLLHTLRSRHSCHWLTCCHKPCSPPLQAPSWRWAPTSSGAVCCGALSVRSCSAAASATRYGLPAGCIMGAQPLRPAPP